MSNIANVREAIQMNLAILRVESMANMFDILELGTVLQSFMYSYHFQYSAHFV